MNKAYRQLNAVSNFLSIPLSFADVYHAESAANAAVSIVLPRLDAKHAIHQIFVSFSAAASSLLTIEDGGFVLFRHLLNNANLQVITFNPPRAQMNRNSEMIISLTAAGSGVIARITVSASRVP